jgi:hypothetical protein
MYLLFACGCDVEEAAQDPATATDVMNHLAVGKGLVGHADQVVDPWTRVIQLGCEM